MKNKLSNQKKLVQQLKKGNSIAYNHLVDLYYKKLCVYASSLARDSYGSEDMVQNVIVKLWQRRESLNSTINLNNYLYKSVYNEFIDQYRRETAITKLEKKYIEGVERFFEDTNEEDTQRLNLLIEEEIDKLPKKCKETFLLSKKEGLTYIEIAEYRNVSVNTVEKQMVKSFSIIREKIKDKAYTFMTLLLGLKKQNQILINRK